MTPNVIKDFLSQVASKDSNLEKSTCIENLMNQLIVEKSKTSVFNELPLATRLLGEAIATFKREAAKYVKDKEANPWLLEMYEKFLDCIEQLGGLGAATATTIHDRMLQKGEAIDVEEIRSRLEITRRQLAKRAGTAEGDSAAVTKKKKKNIYIYIYLSGYAEEKKPGPVLLKAGKYTLKGRERVKISDDEEASKTKQGSICLDAGKYTLNIQGGKYAPHK